MVSLLALALVGAAPAQDCDTRALRGELEDASPVAMASVYVRLAACDPAAAKKQAPAALGRMVGSDGAIDALVAALDVGAGPSVRDWLLRQEPDVRSRSIKKVGAACSEHPSVGDLFVAAHETLGDRFWEDRWHRGLATCRTQGVREMLAAGLESKVVGRESVNRPQFVALLEVYSRNLGAAAVPMLAEWLGDPRDEEEATLLIGTFADAANVGGTDGVDAAAAQLAVAALVEAGPNLPGPAVDRGRGVLVSLGAEDASRAYVANRWRDRIVDGNYRYGVAAFERITCKNGSERANIHLGVALDPATDWPDVLAKAIDGAAKGAWTFDAARKCKGTAEISVVMSERPLEAGADEAWAEEKAEALQTKHAALSPALVWEAPIRR